MHAPCNALQLNMALQWACCTSCRMLLSSSEAPSIAHAGAGLQLSPSPSNVGVGELFCGGTVPFADTAGPGGVYHCHCFVAADPLQVAAALSAACVASTQCCGASCLGDVAKGAKWTAKSGRLGAICVGRRAGCDPLEPGLRLVQPLPPPASSPFTPAHTCCNGLHHEVRCRWPRCRQEGARRGCPCRGCPLQGLAARQQQVSTVVCRGKEGGGSASFSAGQDKARKSTARVVLGHAAAARCIATVCAAFVTAPGLSDLVLCRRTDSPIHLHVLVSLRAGSTRPSPTCLP